jgi:two-component system, cell cycle sensor histidine kinase and response regulator CckA
VQDTGCGMSQEVFKRIFDPFFTTKVTGRGLGLAAVLGLVRRHNGVLTVKTEPGCGTTFRVLFPSVNKEAVVKVVSPTVENFNSKIPTILVVDDELVVRNIAQEMLERSGYNVITAENGQQGIEIFKTNGTGIDAVLLDLTMPDMDGVQVFEEMRAMSPQAKVIISSGYSEAKTVQSFPKDGLSGYLQKPYAPEALVSKLQRIIGR